MKDTTRPFPPLLRAAGIALAVSPAVLGPVIAAASATAAEAPKPAPQRSIAVDYGRAPAAGGDTLESVITVRKLGADDIVGLKITQSVSGPARDGAIGWSVDVAAAGEAVLRSTMTVSPIAPALLRHATVACARRTADTTSIVCASDPDHLPAGSLADRAAAAPDDTVWWIVAGGVGLLGAAVVVTVLMRRRRTRRPAHTSMNSALLIMIMVGTGASTAPVGVEATPVAPIEQAPALVDPIRVEPAGSAALLVAPTEAPPPVPIVELWAVPVTTALPSDRAGVAVATAMAQIGLPYIWGGNGPGAGDAGFDCSGLTTFSYAVAGIQLPRTAQTQFDAGPHLIAGALLEPGDLIFYGTLDRVHHVGMYIGKGRMVNAPTFGMLVQTAYDRWSGDDYLGATRPAAIGQPTTGVLTYTPPTRSPGAPNPSPSPSPIFLAPQAPLPVVAQPATTAPLPAGPSATQTRSPDVRGQASTPAADPTPRTGSSAGAAATAANVPSTDQPTDTPLPTTSPAAASPAAASPTTAPTTTAPPTPTSVVPLAALPAVPRRTATVLAGTVVGPVHRGPDGVLRPPGSLGPHPLSRHSMRICRAAVVVPPRARAGHPAGALSRDLRTMRVMGKLPRVLIVEDNPEISYVIELALSDARLDVRVVGDGDRALAEAQVWAPEVVLLDLNIPGPDGVEVCRRLRQFSDAYVLMLTGRADEVDKLIGLSVGADDYLTKPFSPRELAARVQAMLRRPHGLASTRQDTASVAGGRRSLGSVEIDLATREVEVGGAPVVLTKIEFDLLAALAENVRHVHTRDQLREQVWGQSWLADEHAVDVHMSNLRRKLGTAGAADVITTVRGIGYRITPGSTR